MHNSQYVTQCNTVHNKTLQLQKCNNRQSTRMTNLLKYYVSAFTNTKSDHTLPIRYNNFTRWDAVLRHVQDIVWQFTLLHMAQCHDKKVSIVKFFSRVQVLGNSMCIDKRQSIQLCSPHTGSVNQTDSVHFVPPRRRVDHDCSPSDLDRVELELIFTREFFQPKRTVENNRTTIRLHWPISVISKRESNSSSIDTTYYFDTNNFKFVDSNGPDSNRSISTS